MTSCIRTCLAAGAVPVSVTAARRAEAVDGAARVVVGAVALKLAVCAETFAITR